jgi:epoxyqueuosine reductase
MSIELKRSIVQYAQSLGFGRVGVTSTEPLQAAESRLESWIREGRAGEMLYMARDWRRRARPAEHLPGAKTAIVLAASYFHQEKSKDPSKRARVARYAWGKEYHRVLGKRLESLVRYIQALAPDARCKTFLDTGPLLERALAQKAGLGFIGKNTLLITHGLGSWVFLGTVLTTLELPSDAPDARSCGSCTLCIDACPTQALTGPQALDARRCIAYLTIELKDGIEPELRSQVGDWLFGCDICQEVCPHNTRVPPTPLQEFQSDHGAGAALDVSDVLAIKTEEEFEKRFTGTSLKRAKRHGLLRNACLVASHQGRKDLLPQLQALAEEDPHPVVREHARWAHDQLSKQ